MIQSGRLVLASQSAARAAVLRAAGLRFEQRPARVDEAEVKRSLWAERASADECALTLARLKAERIRDDDTWILGSDQLLVVDGEWLDKPADLAAARSQLVRLRGRRHVLVTAAVCYHQGKEVWWHVAQPRLRMRGFSDAFLDAYLAAEGEALLSCVGGYRLEGLGVQLFDEIDGEHAAILGLPLLGLLDFLRKNSVLLA